MKLSEAILKGCRGTYKIKGRLLYGDGSSGCCATGAALVGICGRRVLNEPAYRGDESHNKFVELFGATPKDIVDEIVRRNNETDETRESIAAWLAEQGY